MLAAMIGQILNRGVVDAQLPLIAERLRPVAGGEEQPFVPGHESIEPGLSQAVTELESEDFVQAMHLLERTMSRSASSSESAAESTAPRRSEIPPLEDYAYIPDDAVTSVVQSALELALRDEFPDRILAAGGRESDRRSGQEDSPVTDEFFDGVTQIPTQGEGRLRRLFGPFEIPSDPRWVGCLVAIGLRRFRHRHKFVDRPAQRRIANNARLVLVGDWGTGLIHANQVARRIRDVLKAGLDEGREQHVLHLGDVYYSGFGYEYRNRLLANWPVRVTEAEAIVSWSLVGNHDMYSGGYGYYEELLMDPRFAGHQGSSYFSLENDHWRVFGLDTGWEEGGLAGSQQACLQGSLGQDRRKTMLLSHHQFFSAYDKGAPILRTKLLPLLGKNPVDVWFWGHEHRCMTFTDHDQIRHGRCIGHGGVPVYQWHRPTDPVPPPGTYEYRDIRQGSFGLEPWAVLGFAVVDFDGPTAQVDYVNEFGFKHHTELLA